MRDEDFDWRSQEKVHCQLIELARGWTFNEAATEVLLELVGINMTGDWYLPPLPEAERLRTAIGLCRGKAMGLVLLDHQNRRGPDTDTVAARFGFPRSLKKALSSLRWRDITSTVLHLETRLRELEEIEVKVAQMSPQRRPASPERQEAHRKSIYDMPEGMYEAMLAKQEGVCRGCRVPPVPGAPLVVDHNHRTGRVRALLCSSCNVALGHVRDRAATLRRLADLMDEDERLS